MFAVRNLSKQICPCIPQGADFFFFGAEKINQRSGNYLYSHYKSKSDNDFSVKRLTLLHEYERRYGKDDWKGSHVCGTTD